MKIVLHRTGDHETPFTWDDYLVRRLVDHRGESWWQIEKRGSGDRSRPLWTLAEVRYALRRRYRETR